MATINTEAGFTGDWEEYIDHIDGLAIVASDATTVTLEIATEEDDPEVAGLDGGQLVLTGSGFLPNVSGGSITQIQLYSSTDPLLFTISGLSLSYDAFVALVAAGDLGELLEEDSEDDDIGDDHGDDDAEDEDENDDDTSKGQAGDDYW